MILLHPPTEEIGKRRALEEDHYTIGRDQTADVVIARDSVSRNHAELKRDFEGNWIVKDLGSTNGSFVNERRVDRQLLRDGDQLRFGDVIYKFLSGSNIESAYHEEIYRLTILDGLTGVHNKRYLLDFLEREMASAKRHKHPLSLVMFDIDHFKKINDEKGHLCGDAVLKQLTRRIKTRMRREDLFARYGGEEFCAVLTVTALEGGVRFAEAVRTIIAREAFSFDGDEFHVTVSCGVATCNGDLESEQLIKAADDNLYAAKHGGRNRVVPGLNDVRRS
jgi:diguanylate cyclase (GGDEF)-like protein